MAEQRAEYKHVGGHVQDLASGRMIGPGETVRLSDEEVRDPHNEALIKEGILIPTGSDAEPDATEAAADLARQSDVSLNAVTGTGSGGTITKGDVERHIAEQASAEGSEG